MLSGGDVVIWFQGGVLRFVIRKSQNCRQQIFYVDPFLVEISVATFMGYLKVKARIIWCLSK